MTTLGLVGGLGPESTIDYYRRILGLWEGDEPGTSPSIVIDSLDVQHALRLVEHDRPALVAYLLASLKRLAGAVADFGAIAANTAHVVFGELEAASPLPLVSIVEVAAAAAGERGLTRVAVLGTRFTMEADFYPEVCGRRGIAVVTPDAGERTWLHQRYIIELLRGEFRVETREGVVDLVRRLHDRHRIDGVILAGTELPLLLKSPDIAGLPLLDTTELHVAALVRRLRDRA